MADVEQATVAVATITMPADKKAAKEAEAAASAAATAAAATASDEAILSWTSRYPAKLKAVVWNLKENSVRVYESTPGRTMKYLALGTAVLLFLGVLSLVLAHKDEQQSTSVQNKYSMAFTLEDAVTGPRSEKRVHFGSIPGESASASLVSLASALSSQSESAPSTVSPSSSSSSSSSSSETGREVESDDNSVTTIVTPKDETVNNNSKESAGQVFPGGEASILIGSSGASSDDEDKDDSADQRIVFIERLMGLHFASPSGENNPTDAASDSNDDVIEKKKVNNSKWASRIRKISPSSSSSSSAASDVASSSSSLDQSMPDSIQVQAHPMLRYAAAAMMSRLIAAAARAQMENQAKEQQQQLTLVASRGGAKDKDDDAEEESIPVLLASLRDGPSENTFRSRSTHMYGRPMARASSRGPLFTSSSSTVVNRFSPSSSRAAPSIETIHPLIQHLQALQALSSLQRLQRQREMTSQMEGSVTRQGDRALVMLAIPIASQESRPNIVATNAYGGMSPFSRPSHYYMSGQAASPYATYSAPMTSAYVRPMASHSVAMHPALSPPAGNYYGQYHHRPTGHYLPPPPPPASAAASAPHYTSYHASHPVSARSGQPLHPAYSHVRPVVEVPIEVPVEVPVHVPVPVAAYSAPTIVGHPAIHAIASQAAALAGHRGPIEHDNSDTATSDSSDQIVLLYDAEFHPDNENDNGNHATFNSNHNSDDLQSSASESKPINNKVHHFLSTSSLPSNPSYHKMKLFHEMMSQKHASQPGVRYLPIALQSNDHNNNPLPQQSSSHMSPVNLRAAFDTHQISHEITSHQQTISHSQIPPTQATAQQQQSAFIVISADDQQQPQQPQQQQQQRDQSTLQPVVVERR